MVEGIAGIVDARRARYARAVADGLAAATEAERVARERFESMPCRTFEDAWINARCNLSDAEDVADEWRRADEVAYPTLTVVGDG